MEPNDPSYLGNLCRKVDSVASVIFYTLLGISFVPLWFFGDMVELVFQGNKQFRDPVQPFKINDNQMLDPNKTTHMGASISTYQYTSDPKFCERSDWGRYSKHHFAGESAGLGPGKGVDVLTDEGMKTLADTILDGHGNAIRFSVEWADVLNIDGTFNDVAMQRYINAAKYFKERELKVIICLHHFVTPLDKNGKSLFESAGNIKQFVDYAKYVYKKMKPHTNQFMTFNEPNVVGVQNHILGMFPAGGKGNFWKHTLVLRNMLEAHTRVHKELHLLAGAEKVEVGLSHQALKFIPSSRWNYIARIAAYVFTYIFHTSFMQWAVKNTKSLDFLGVQYYSTPLLGGFPPDSIGRKGETMVGDMRFRFHPQGLYPILMDIGKRLGPKVPLLVTETGTAGTNDCDKENGMDKQREKYMRQSLAAFRAAQKSLNLVGFLYWGLVTNFEWNHGYKKSADFGMTTLKGENGEHRHTLGWHAISNVFENTKNAIARIAHLRAG